MSKIIVTVARTGGMAFKAQSATLATRPAKLADGVDRSILGLPEPARVAA